jgi:hypothetical protein
LALSISAHGSASTRLFDSSRSKACLQPARRIERACWQIPFARVFSPARHPCKTSDPRIVGRRPPFCFRGVSPASRKRAQARHNGLRRSCQILGAWDTLSCVVAFCTLVRIAGWYRAAFQCLDRARLLF